MTVTEDVGGLLAAAVQEAARHAELRGGGSIFDRQLWDELTGIGVPTLLLPEQLGGEGGSLTDVMAALQAAYRYPLEVPLADVAVVTAAVCRTLGLSAPDGITVVLPELTANDRGTKLSGTVEGVPWARHADTVIVLVDSTDGTARHAEVALADIEVIQGANLAEEPRDTVRLDSVETVASEGAAAALRDVRSWGALARSAQMCGALTAILELTVLHATTREQFGQPLSAFQAVQHHLAAMAGEVVSAKASLDLAVELVTRNSTMLAIAAAVTKTRTGAAANECARLAHQVHGAIGFTREHDLQRYTRRLWSWRDEFGTEREWSERLGRLVPGDLLWQTMTDVP